MILSFHENLGIYIIPFSNCHQSDRFRNTVASKGFTSFCGGTMRKAERNAVRKAVRQPVA